MPQTYVINVIGGPGSGKTTTCALLFAQLKLLGYTVEYVQEVAKGLVWAKDYDLLDNQYWVSQRQYKSMICMKDKVDFIVTDGCLLHGHYYNHHNPYNVSDQTKTEAYIWKCYQEFQNINIYLERGDFPYEQAGRQQNESEALEIDRYFTGFLVQHKVPHQSFQIINKGDHYSVEHMIKYIVDSIDSVPIKCTGA